MLFINNLVLRKVKPIAEEIATGIQHTVKIVSAYQVLSAKIESESFQSPLLRGLQAAFRTDEYSAAVEIGKLKKILDVLQSRGSKRQFNNMFYGILNNLLFIDIYLVLAVESWNSKNATRLATWSDTVGEFEALCSLAGFAYANPAFNYPEITDTPHVISFDAIGHPLLPATRRICNDFNLRGRGDMAMITGSNMAGKSTFLRTVGINIVLALTGAPCCAQRARVSHMQVFTSMRTQDNLEEGVSSFYAELKRIAQLLKLIESGRPLFFMLDEMFKGTNSKDRHRGGFSLIRQLRELNAFGMISTHDLDLATLTEKHTLVTNYSFNSTMEGDRLVFSYRLTPGLCKDFNASALMQQNGIKILSDVDM
jgi:DNA mismatch repair ATPase MutS